MFEEKPDFSTSDLHELHDRKLRNQFMIEQNRECQYYFWTFLAKKTILFGSGKYFTNLESPPNSTYICMSFSRSND